MVGCRLHTQAAVRVRLAVAAVCLIAAVGTAYGAGDTQQTTAPATAAPTAGTPVGTAADDGTGRRPGSRPDDNRSLLNYPFLFDVASVRCRRVHSVASRGVLLARRSRCTCDAPPNAPPNDRRRPLKYRFPCAWRCWAFKAKARTASACKRVCVGRCGVPPRAGRPPPLRLLPARSPPSPQRLVRLLDHTLRKRTPAGVQGWDPAHTEWSWRPLGAVYNIQYEVVHIGGTLLAQYEQVRPCVPRAVCERRALAALGVWLTGLRTHDGVQAGGCGGFNRGQRVTRGAGRREGERRQLAVQQRCAGCAGRGDAPDHEVDICGRRTCWTVC